MKMAFFRFLRCSKGLLTALAVISVLNACGGGGGNASAPTSSSATSSSSIASLLVVANKSTVKADGVDSVTLTLRGLDSSNAAIKGAALSISATSGLILSSSSVTTDSTTGAATVTVTADQTNQVNRVASVTLSCGSCAAANTTYSITIAGATLSLVSSSNSLVAGGAAVTLEAFVKDVSGNSVPDGTVVTFTSTDTTYVTVSASSRTTSGGKASVTISGVSSTSSDVPVNVSVLGAASSAKYAVSAPTNALSISSPSSGTAFVTGVGQLVTVTAPGTATTVNFSATSAGTWTPSSAATVSGGVASATFTPSQAGSLTITVNDNSSTPRIATQTYRVSSPVSAVDKIQLSAGQTTLAVATGSSTPSVKLTVQALDVVNSTTEQGVANVPVLFTYAGGPGAGEYITPALAYTDSSGFAYADFYAGTAPTNSGPVIVAAQIQGTAIKTGTAPSSNSVSLSIGGQATSVSFGSASVLRESTDKTLYMLDHSVQVTDASGNAVSGATVSLRVIPVAFSTGSSCTVANTYCSEDANGSGSLDSGEDGVRKLITTTTTGSCSSAATTPGGGTDGILTPSNSYAGSVPATVRTGSDGTASFALTYLKAASIWTVVKLTATVGSGTTETSNSTVFRLSPSKGDVDLPDTCYIANSPFAF